VATSLTSILNIGVDIDVLWNCVFRLAILLIFAGSEQLAEMEEMVACLFSASMPMSMQDLMVVMVAMVVMWYLKVNLHLEIVFFCLSWITDVSLKL
jgi:hypothetical protein